MKLAQVACEFALAFALFATGCGDLCGNEKLADHLSPDGSWHVVVFQRACGATTGYSTQVSVLRAGDELPNEGGNVFVADTDHGAAPAGPGGGPNVDVKWETAGRLLISHDSRARVFKAVTQWHSLEVRYEGLE